MHSYFSGTPASCNINRKEIGNTGTQETQEHTNTGTQGTGDTKTQGTQEIPKPLSWGKKILEFYKAPATKFWANTVSSSICRKHLFVNPGFCLRLLLSPHNLLAITNNLSQTHGATLGVAVRPLSLIAAWDPP